MVLVFAYSSFVRTLCWLAYRYLITLMLVKTPAYDRLYLSMDWKSAELTRKVEDEVQSMKARVKKAKQKRTAEQLNNELQLQADKERRRGEKRAKGGEPARDGTAQDGHELHDILRRGGHQNGAAGQGQPGAGMSVASGPISPPPVLISHAATAPEHAPRDLESLGGPSKRRRRPPFLPIPSTRSDAAQTTPGLLEEAPPLTSNRRPDGAA